MRVFERCLFAVWICRRGFRKPKKYTAYDRFHGNGPYGKIPTKKESIRTLGFTSRLSCHIIKKVIIWLAPRAGKMTQIARCDWLPERARWSHLARSGLSTVYSKQNYPESHIINPSLTKFARSRWLDIGLVLFCEFMDLDFVSVHNLAKKELGQYLAILTSHLVNNPYIFLESFCSNFRLS